jgi:hypothetical protein
LPTGEEILFAPGQIWVALTDKQPVFTPATSADSADAAAKSSK